MAYLGKDLVGMMSYSRAKDTMTGDGSTTTLTLSRDPGTQNNVEIYMDGVLQTPGVEYTLSGKVVTFTTAPETGLNVVALSGTETEIMEPADNSVVASHLVGGLSLTDAKITGLSSSKLSGALPALDGSALTNMSGGINVKSASDPATNTNHANGVGTTWVNTTSGEMFVCTDATTDANVWFNVGAGTGNVEPYSYLGSTKGYAMAGWSLSTSGYIDTSNSFSLVNDGNATDIGNMTTTGNAYGGGFNSNTHGYTVGGLGVPSFHGDVSRMPFASEGDSTDVGDLGSGRYFNHGGCHSASTHGYTSGGLTHNATYDDVIMKFAYGSSVTGSEVASLTRGTRQLNGCTSATHGFTHGNETSGSHSKVIDKFEFATDSDAVGHGDLYESMNSNWSNSSETHGFSIGGMIDGTNSAGRNRIERFAFASNVTAADYADLWHGRNYGIGVSGTTHGYSCGGNAGPNSSVNIIQKFQYASTSMGTDVGDLVVTAHGMASYQI